MREQQYYWYIRPGIDDRKQPETYVELYAVGVTPDVPLSSMLRGQVRIQDDKRDNFWALQYAARILCESLGLVLEQVPMYMSPFDPR